MGQEFCKGCDENCLSTNIEGDFSYKQILKQPVEKLVFKSSENNDNIFYDNMNKSIPSILITQNKIKENEKNTEVFKYDFKDNENNNYYNNFTNNSFNNTYKTNNKNSNDINTSFDYNCNINFFNSEVDVKKLTDIILKYKINLIIKYLRKFVVMKNKILKEIIIENYTNNNSNSFLSLLKNQNNKKKILEEPDINISPNNDYLFIGHKFNNKKEGYCLEIYPDINARCFAEYKDGKKNGLCRFSIMNVDTSYCYFGEARDNKINGFGYFENCQNGTKYKGEWKNSLRNGYGIENYDDGSFYEGEFLN